MTMRLSIVDRADRITPPLQSHMADQRLADHFANCRDFDVEGIECKEWRFAFGWAEQGREVSIVIVAPYLLGDVLLRIDGAHFMTICDIC